MIDIIIDNLFCIVIYFETVEYSNKDKEFYSNLVILFCFRKHIW